MKFQPTLLSLLATRAPIPLYDVTRAPVPRLCEAELPIDIAAAGSKGMGAFARTAAAAGTFVCNYVGEQLTEAEIAERYADEDPLYLFLIHPDEEPKYIDARDSIGFVAR